MTLDARIWYPSENSPGIVCQIYAGYVYEAGEPNARPLKDYVYGKFVRLVTEEEAIADFVRAVYKRAEQNMATNGTVSGAHWNAIRQELAARGTAEPAAKDAHDAD